MRFGHKLTFIAVAVSAVIVPSFLVASDNSDDSDNDNRSFTMRLDTPPVVGIQRADGMAELRIGKFRTRTASVGAPDVPSRTTTKS